MGRTRTDARRPARTRGRAALAACKLAVAGALAALLGSCSPSVDHRPPVGGVPDIRVLLADRADGAEVAIRGPFEVRLIGDAEEPRVLISGDELSARTVRVHGGDVIVDGVVRTPCTVEFAPAHTPVRLNGRPYRGVLRVSPASGRLRIVNVLDLESYLRGVVPSEAIASWPRAALEAQAVAARTYALAKIREREQQPCDVRPSTADQVYGGCDKEDERTDAAIAATAGRVLHCRGRVFTAYYHACCGGGTADARQVFADPTPAMRGVDCSYCTKCPRYKWSFEISRDRLAARIRVPGLTGLQLQGIGLDGRVEQVTLQRAGKAPLVMAGIEFRRRIGTWRTLTRRMEGLLSTKFSVAARGDDFQFEGQGWGHGVGMCQWGAKGMADVGRTCAQILDHYYPGTEETKAY